MEATWYKENGRNWMEAGTVRESFGNHIGKQYTSVILPCSHWKRWDGQDDLCQCIKYFSTVVHDCENESE